MKASIFLVLPLLFMPAPAQEGGAFRFALDQAEKALSTGNLKDARLQIDRALERDSRSQRAWALRARLAEAGEDRDDLVYSLHRQYKLAIAQKADKGEVETLRTRLAEIDPISTDLINLSTLFIEKLLPVADRYEKEGRPHSAIRIHQEILALNSERAESKAAIERISSAPDPSLAETAKPKDLLADVSEEWIKEYDEKHKEWKNRAKYTGENYVTYTNAGYEVLVRSAEAMEQMNAFYRKFFRYGGPGDNRSVSRITLNIFKTRDEYLKMGIGPPVEWSGGHFTGGAVETYIGQGGFRQMTGVLFHEAAHQFVSLATSASGWLNEGLASFFEGTQILSNGTVRMNLPANHRLFPLASRMDKGWMTDHMDGINPDKPSDSSPTKAPTFAIILENKYEWGPPWYAPTWGLVYFLYNYQDPVDGRFIYRSAFQDFINSSGGRMGTGAILNFEKVVLANPAPPTPAAAKNSEILKTKTLPTTASELDELWKEYILRLRDEQSGKLEVKRPYLDWARYAVKRQEWDNASEHFEKGLVESPNNVELLSEFAEVLAKRFDNPDRATKLIMQALRIVESKKDADKKQIKKLDSMLARWDKKRKTLERIHEDMYAGAKTLVQRYMAEELYSMAMDLSWRLGRDLNVPGMFEYYEQAYRIAKKSLVLWQLAYNESNLDGWDASTNKVYTAYGPTIRASNGTFAEDRFDYNFLTFDKVTSGDFSMEAEILSERGKNLFCGLLFGQKGTSSFHSVILFPGRKKDPKRNRLEQQGRIDLSTFTGPDQPKVWQSLPVDTRKPGWHKVRLDITGRWADVWFDGELVCSQEFPNLEVLRGNFGLIMGPGGAQYRNIRYLARDAMDPASLIERKIRMEKYNVVTGKSAGGSWMGQVPPWPKTAWWAQKKRTGWREKGPVPQLLVFWSMTQNDAIPIHEWLEELQDESQDIGLEIISICSRFDPSNNPLKEQQLKDYLDENPFPCPVGVDYVNKYKGGIGTSFEQYRIDKFNLPRLLLLDIDHKVVWEGDPGFRQMEPFESGMETLLDGPLNLLVEKRKLHQLREWKQKWKETAVPALRRGDLKTAHPIMVESKELPGDIDPTVADAWKKLEDLENALDALELTAQTFERNGYDPALETLLGWGKFIKWKLSRDTKVAVNGILHSQRSKDWKRIKDLSLQAIKNVKADRAADALNPLFNQLAKYEGQIFREYEAELKATLEEALEGGDYNRLKQLLKGVKQRPASWLARDFFRY